MGSIRIDTNKLNKAIAGAFDQTVERVSQSFDDAIKADIYEYPRPTKRRNKSVVTSPRDIYDLGNLHDSKVVARSSSSEAAEFSWQAEYSLACHEGYTTKSGVEIPPRRWTEKALEGTNPAEVFEQELRRYL